MFWLAIAMALVGAAASLLTPGGARDRGEPLVPVAQREEPLAEQLQQ